MLAEELADSNADKTLAEQTADPNADKTLAEQTADPNADKMLAEQLADLNADKMLVEQLADPITDKTPADLGVTYHTATVASKGTTASNSRKLVDSVAMTDLSSQVASL